LLDSGATKNFIRTKQLTFSDVQPDPDFYTLACGESAVRSHGIVHETITLGDRDFEVPFHLIPGLNEEMILGAQFLIQEHALMDYQRRCTYVGRSDRSTIFWTPKLRPDMEFTQNVTIPQLDIPSEHRAILLPILTEFSDVFEPPAANNTTLTTQHTIELTDPRPIHQRPYPLSPAKTKILYDQLNEMLANGIVEPSTSQYSSPPVLVERSGKAPRFCVDYRKINAVTKSEASSLPKIAEVLKSFGEAAVFTVLDLKSGYWQIPLNPASKQYTAFSTPDGATYHFNVLPFGLKNAPSCFQNVMTREVLAGYLHHFAQVYLDDIIIYRTIAEHRDHLRLVLERMRQHNLKVSPEKCKMATDNLEYLGHQIRGTVTRPLNKHLEAIQNFPRPTSRKQLQSFLGICNWVREYVADAASLTKPLTVLLQKQHKFNWTAECQEAFDVIKCSISQPLELHRPNFAFKFYLQVDASLIGLGAVLFQKGDLGERRIISYASVTLTEAEKRYHVNELEVFAAIFGIKRYRAYLADKAFTLITDSRALYWLEKNRDTKAKLTRWSLLLQEYDFDVEHCAGKENQLADYLSRNASEPHSADLVDESRMLPPERVGALQQITHHDLYLEVQAAQQRSPRVRQSILRWYDIDRNGPQDGQDARFHETYRVSPDHTTIFKRANDDDLLVIPRRKVLKVIHHFHDSDDAAHPGVDETVRAVQRMYHARHLRRQVSSYVRRCLPCHAVKSRQIQKNAPQKPHTARSPFETISIDVLGPYPETQLQNRFVIIVEDIYTKWVEAKAVPDSTAPTICDFLESEIFTRYGDPKQIISDNGPVFDSNRYLTLCRKRHIQPFYTAVYFQRENPVERKVQDFKTVLKVLRYRQPRLRNWDRLVPQSLAIIRNRRNRATGETPSKPFWVTK
jgi:Reverse transcriptase (RNA-dependent DNA polymerase)./Integrase core domain.